MNPKLNALLIEDDPDDERLLQRLCTSLRPMSVGLLCAKRLTQGLELLTTNPIDTILLDLFLPDSSGLATLERVHAQAPNAAIIVLTSLDQERIALEAVQRYAQDYLIKGRVDREVLARTLRYAVERKRTEQALKHSEALLDGIIDHSPHAMWISDNQGTLTRLNQACRDLLHITEAQVVGKYNVLEDELIQAQGFMPLVHQVFESGETVRFTLEYDTSQLKHLAFEKTTFAILDVTISPIVDGRGAITNAIGQCMDLTARTHAMEALCESEGRFRGLFENASVGIFHSTPAGTFLQVNPALATMLGYASPEELVSSVTDINTQIFLDSQRCPELVGAAVNQAGWIHAEHRFRRKDGSTLSGKLAIRKVLNPDGSLTYLEGFVEDITDREHAEQEILKRAEQLGLLYDAGLTLNQILDPHAQMEFLLKIARQSLRADRAEFFQVDANTDRICLQRAIGFSQSASDQMRKLSFSPETDHHLAWVARHRVPLNLPEVSRDPRHVPRDPGIRSGLWVPVQREEQLLGIIAMSSTRPSAFSPHDEQLLMLFASQIAVALENARLFAAEHARRNELASLYELSRRLADSTDLAAILELAAHQATLTVATTSSRIGLLEKDELVVRAAFPTHVLVRDLQVGRRIPLADLPFCRRVLEQATPSIARADSHEMSELEHRFLFSKSDQTVCLVPLHAGVQQFGLLMLCQPCREGREPFSPEELYLASSIGDQLASALSRSQLQAQTNRRLEQLGALRKIDQAIAGSLDLRVTLAIFLDQVVPQLRVDAADVLLLNHDTRALEFAAARGFRSGKVKELSVPLGKGRAGRAALERRTITVPHHHNHEPDTWQSALFNNEGFVAHYSVPLIAKGEVKGVLDVYHRSPLEASAEWLAFLELLAGQAAIAIDNARLFENLQRANMNLASAYDATLEGWSRALDLRDKETEGHTRRVIELTLRLARSFGLAEMDLVHVRRGALLHDIGKMGIPDHILLKPSSLTAEEWEVMRKHPKYAYDLLSPIVYLQPALDIPYCHHEKWDGTGYPRALKGDRIPLAARIFAVVDVWDALRSDRPYRRAWTEDEAREYIRAQAGRNFDPQVVGPFLNMEL